MKNLKLSVIWLLSLVLALYLGYYQGSLNEKIERLPFDLGIYLMMHEMSEFIHSSGIDGAKLPWNSSNAETLLYATLDFYDQNEERFDKEREDSPIFVERIEKARKVTKGLELVTIGSILEEKADKHNTKGGE